jgi:Domain of unknown function (DUF6985)
MKLRDQLRRLRERWKPRRVDDPVFGGITFHRGANGVWSREAETDGYCVRIFAGESGPSDGQRSLWTEFENRRDELLAKIQQPMFDEYNTIREDEAPEYEKAGPDIKGRFNEDFPELKAASGIWTIARLDAVEVMGDGYPLDLCLLFDMDWGDPEHVLSVTMKDWAVVHVGKEG